MIELKLIDIEKNYAWEFKIEHLRFEIQVSKGRWHLYEQDPSFNQPYLLFNESSHSFETDWRVKLFVITGSASHGFEATRNDKEILMHCRSFTRAILFAQRYVKSSLRTLSE